MDWKGKRVLVTGGASFIGSHLVDALVEAGALVRVADDLSSGKLSNIEGHIKRDTVEFLNWDLFDRQYSYDACSGTDILFHLAAAHGGRGYVDSHQYVCARNTVLDGIVFQAARWQGVEKIVFASSACVYPVSLCQDPDEHLYLREEQVGPPYDPDGSYGLAKLHSELMLKHLHKEFGVKTASCRLFHVYGPRAVENHALIAMTARAFLKQSPFVVWGTGQQIRNWTHVSDIVRGLMLAAEKIDDGTAVNLGTEDRIRVIAAVYAILKATGHQAEIEFSPNAPTGPYNRVGSGALARELLGWEPRVDFQSGLDELIGWYYATKTREQVQVDLVKKLTER